MYIHIYTFIYICMYIYVCICILILKQGAKNATHASWFPGFRIHLCASVPRLTMGSAIHSGLTTVDSDTFLRCVRRRHTEHVRQHLKSYRVVFRLIMLFGSVGWATHSYRWGNDSVCVYCPFDELAACPVLSIQSFHCVQGRTRITRRGCTGLSRSRRI